MQAKACELREVVFSGLELELVVVDSNLLIFE